MSKMYKEEDQFFKALFSVMGFCFLLFLVTEELTDTNVWSRYRDIFILVYISVAVIICHAVAQMLRSPDDNKKNVFLKHNRWMISLQIMWDMAWFVFLMFLVCFTFDIILPLWVYIASGIINALVHLMFCRWRYKAIKRTERWG